MLSRLSARLLTSVALLVPLSPAEAQGPARVLLIYDMEGVAAVTRPTDVQFGSPGYAAARAALTREVNAAVRGLLAAGAHEVTLVDGHGSGNPEPDYDETLIPRGARLEMRDAPYDAFFDAVDSSFAAVVGIGMHGGAGGRGFLSHTYYHHTRWRMADLEMNESMIIAASAGRFGVPLIFVTGDDVLGAEVKAFSPRTVTVAVKRAASRTSIERRDSAAVERDIEAAARRAFEGRRDILPWRPILPPTIDNRFAYTLAEHASLAANFPRARLMDDRTVSLTTASFEDAYLAFRALANFTILAPLRTLVEVLPRVEGGPEALQRVRQQVATRQRPGFTPTGAETDPRFSAFARFGYR